MPIAVNLKYPKVMPEQATIDAALSGRSLARFGDGELRIAVGSACSSQRGDKKLAGEFRNILVGKTSRSLLPCIPNMVDCPRAEAWRNYADDKYVKWYQAKQYGSAFITRPDNMPKIDNQEYWASVRRLWHWRDVVLVRGDEKSLTKRMLADAKSVREVIGPRQHAYEVIDQIEEEIGKPSGPVIMCLGATATALAARLAAKGVWALDLGHLGMFMRHMGAYTIPLEFLRSRKYQQLLMEMHANSKWGSDGHKHAAVVLAFRDEINALSLLDYGCGKGTLAEALAPEQRTHEYDPGVEGKAGFPKPADLVCCTDVLEHVEPFYLDDVLRHILLLAGKGIYLSISLRPANAQLPDGRNAHLIQQSQLWWVEKLRAVNYPPPARIEHSVSHGELRLWFIK